MLYHYPFIIFSHITSEGANYISKFSSELLGKAILKGGMLFSLKISTTY